MKVSIWKDKYFIPNIYTNKTKLRNIEKYCRLQSVWYIKNTLEITAKAVKDSQAVRNSYRSIGQAVKDIRMSKVVEHMKGNIDVCFFPINMI